MFQAPAVRGFSDRTLYCKSEFRRRDFEEIQE
jgi:hypothetical protein